ncbi:hypothetical protein [Methylobacterium phyllosphaerae]|nr:hypothetical protein [Methylobacterium phyllosphaerae]
MTSRWFTDPAAAGPAPINRTFTPFEESHFTAILEFARNPANENWENLRCLDASGTVVHDMSVGVKAAPSTDKMEAAIKARTGVRQWHNHPSEDSLSHYDWQFAAWSPHIEILVLNKRESFFVGRIVKEDDRFNHIFPWLSRLSTDLHFEIDRIAKKQKLDFSLFEPLSKLTGHILNTALATCCSSVRYAYHLSPDDQAVVAACSSLRILQDGLEYARLAIEQEFECLRLWKTLKTADDRAQALEFMRNVGSEGR